MEKAAERAAASYELPLQEKVAQAPPGVEESGDLTGVILYRNAAWFCRIRWIPVAILVMLGAVDFLMQGRLLFGFIRIGRWPAVIAPVLAAANVLSILHLRRIAAEKPQQAVILNLWMQIILDLLILTVVVYFVGSLKTTMPFLYLIHITLACTFFSRRHSFAVLLTAYGFYFCCLVCEGLGIVPAASIYTEPIVRGKALTWPRMAMIDSLSTAVIWLIVWYLASNLSAVVRQRDFELAETNRQLVASREQKTALMLRTTHELKAPFAAIHANIQLLLNGSCGPFSEEAREILGRMSARCHRLANLIQEMLQLANLEKSISEPERVNNDLAEIIRWTLTQMEPQAKVRNIKIKADLQPATTVAAEDHLKMMLGNILSNAIVYSRSGSEVRISCRREPSGAATVIIEDKGIGIPAEKLPHIFDDYYRTSEAAQFNPESTGLGLAIVRHIAQAYGIRIRVESAPEVGTRFSLYFPLNKTEGKAS